MDNKGYSRRRKSSEASTSPSSIVTPLPSNSPHIQNTRNAHALNDPAEWVSKRPGTEPAVVVVSAGGTSSETQRADTITTRPALKPALSNGSQSNRHSREASHASEVPSIPVVQQQQRPTTIPQPRKRSSSLKLNATPSQSQSAPAQVNKQSSDDRKESGVQIVFKNELEVAPPLESLAVPLQYTFAVPSLVESRDTTPSTKRQSYSIHRPVTVLEEVRSGAAPTTRPVSHSLSRKHVHVDNENDMAHPLPFEVTQETFAVPATSPDDGRVEGQDPLLWKPGQPLRIAYITWNMAAREAIPSQVSAFCVQPNAHIISICTQENGSLTNVTGRHNKWESILSDLCLNGLYDMLDSKSMWNIHLAVFARSRDVARYVVNVHDGSVATGIIGGMGGNKGGIGIGLALRMLPLDKTGIPPSSPFDLPPAVGYNKSSKSRPVSSTGERGLYPTRALLEEMEKKPEHPTTSVSPPHEAIDNPLGSSKMEEHQLGRDVSATFSTEEEMIRRSIFTPVAPPRRVSVRRVNQNSNGEELRVPASVSTSPARSPPLVSAAAPIPVGRIIHSTLPSEMAAGESSAFSEEVEEKANATYLTILFVGAHLAAHQEAVELRNQDYQTIIRRLPVGIRGPYRSFFLKHLMHNGGLRHCRVSGKNAQRVMTWIKRNRSRKSSQVDSQSKGAVVKPESATAAQKSTVVPLTSFEIYGASKTPQTTASRVEDDPFNRSAPIHTPSSPLRKPGGAPRPAAGVRTSKGLQGVRSSGHGVGNPKGRKDSGSLRIHTNWSSETSSVSSGGTDHSSWSSESSCDGDDSSSSSTSDSSSSTTSSASFYGGDLMPSSITDAVNARSKAKVSSHRGSTPRQPGSPFMQPATAVLPPLNPTGKKGMVKDSRKETSKLRSSIEAALRGKVSETEKLQQKKKKKHANRALKRRLFRKVKRDVTNEFDITFFGGDLNYRINGTRQGIEWIVTEQMQLRSVLMVNDQLNLEKAKGNTLQGFREANLLFRPTYKYEVKDGVTQDIYNLGTKKAKKRLPAYCDRILYKQPAWARRTVELNNAAPHESTTFFPMRSVSALGSTSNLNMSKSLSTSTASPLIPSTAAGAGSIEVRLYTDVPNVRTSDHRPVVALFDLDTFTATFNSRAPNTPLRKVKLHEKRQKRPTTAQVSFENEK